MAKITLNWVEVLLITLLVLGGMGTWLAMDDLAERSVQDRALPEEYYTLTSEVPRRQAELDAAQTQVEALQDELSKKQVELSTQTSHLKDLEQTYPALAKLSQAPQQAQQLNIFIESWAQAEQARMLSQALEVQVGELITHTAQLSDTLNTQTAGSLAYKQAEARLSLALDELSEAQRALVAQRVETARLVGVLRAQAALNPGAAATWESLRQTASSANGVLPPPPLVLQDYLSTLGEYQGTKAEITSLESTAQDTLKTIEERSAALGQAQMQARRSHQVAQTSQLNQKAASAMLSLFGIGGYLLFFYAVLKESLKHHKYKINFKNVFMGAGIPLAFLWTYQALGMMCSSALVTLGFIGLMILLTRELSAKSSQQDSTQGENKTPAQPDNPEAEIQPPALASGLSDQAETDLSQEN